jgi:hypothetical protein
MMRACKSIFNAVMLVLYNWRGFSIRFLVDLPLFALLAFVAHEVAGAVALEGRLRVVPVLFIPSDNSEIDGGKVAAYKDLVRKYLVLAQSYYRTQLITDTFEIVDGDPLVYAAKHPHSYYIAHFTREPNEMELMVRELFDWLGEDRYSSRSVYLMIYARPSAHALPAPLRYPIDDNYFGHGDTFNGPPNTGGGVIQLELQYLTDDYPFLSTLIHELGHAFGLPHADCYGYNMGTNGSMMASNSRLWSNGFDLSVPPPIFNPEEYLILSQNKLAFPNFNFIPALHNPRGKSLATVDSCTGGGGMSETIGKYRDMPGMGFELFWDGKRINGPEAAFYSRQEAREDCVWNTQTYPRVRVTCTYNGEPFTVPLAVQAPRNRRTRPSR